jgi:hypothetical protein
MAEQTTTSTTSRRKRARRSVRRADSDSANTAGNRVLDVYGTVTGNGDARSIDRISDSIRDALA